jgi:UDPglucose 6-dehydrogenase
MCHISVPTHYYCENALNGDSTGGFKLESYVGIFGYGVVGKQMHKLFPSALIYDKYTAQKQDLSGCKIAFIAVPTPLKDSVLDETELEDAVKNCPSGLLVLRSATNPGFADRMSKKYGKRILVQPEYLGETVNHPFAHGAQPPFLVIGGAPSDRRELIDLYATVYHSNIKIRQVTALEAEVIKLSENRAIMYKLMQIQELFDACEASGVDFYTVREAVYGDDPRFNLWWSFVYPHNRGADSKCLPKDVYAWEAWARKNGAKTTAISALLQYNKYLVGTEGPNTNQPEK